MDSRSTKLHSKRVVLHSDTDALGVPATAPGAGSVPAAWNLGTKPPRLLAVAVDLGPGAAGSSAISAGAYWSGYDAKEAKWRRCRDFNGGAAITITSGEGFEENLSDLAGAFSMIQLVATATEELTITAKPLEVEA